MRIVTLLLSFIYCPKIFTPEVTELYIYFENDAVVKLTEYCSKIYTKTISTKFQQIINLLEEKEFSPELFELDSAKIYSFKDFCKEKYINNILYLLKICFIDNDGLLFCNKIGFLYETCDNFNIFLNEITRPFENLDKDELKCIKDILTYVKINMLPKMIRWTILSEKQHEMANSREQKNIFIKLHSQTLNNLCEFKDEILKHIKKLQYTLYFEETYLNIFVSLEHIFAAFLVLYLIENENNLCTLPEYINKINENIVKLWNIDEKNIYNDNKSSINMNFYMNHTHYVSFYERIVTCLCLLPMLEEKTLKDSLLALKKLSYTISTFIFNFLKELMLKKEFDEKFKIYQKCYDFSYLAYVKEYNRINKYLKMYNVQYQKIYNDDNTDKKKKGNVDCPDKFSSKVE